MPETTLHLSNPDKPQNWKTVLAYDGTDFSGWQVQPGLSTVQGELARAIQHVTGEAVLPQGSGRTDAGVHALGQVASFQLQAAIPPQNLLRALNRSLSPAVRILTAEIVPAEFHARHSAVGKTYEYRIFRGEICPPFIARYALALNWPLDVTAMQAAAANVVGEHDFTSLAAVDPDLAQREGDTAPPSTVRTIHRSEWQQKDEFLIYRVTGTGFLHHMVRNLVGTFLDIGRGHLAPDAVPKILAARSRAAAGPTAGPSGLFLVSVDYGVEP
jgi:tRNA pseudouridine38-40 synthase